MHVQLQFLVDRGDEEWLAATGLAEGDTVHWWDLMKNGTLLRVLDRESSERAKDGTGRRQQEGPVPTEDEQNRDAVRRVCVYKTCTYEDVAYQCTSNKCMLDKHLECEQVCSACLNSFPH